MTVLHTPRSEAALDLALALPPLGVPEPPSAALEGGCLAPIAAYHDGQRLEALVAAEDGSWVERRTGDDPVALAAELRALVP